MQFPPELFEIMARNIDTESLKEFSCVSKSARRLVFDALKAESINLMPNISTTNKYGVRTRKLICSVDFDSRVFKEVEELHIIGNGAVMKPFGHMPGLKTLVIESCKIDFFFIVPPSVTRVKLRKCDISGGIYTVATSVVVSDLRENAQVSTGIIAAPAADRVTLMGINLADLRVQTRLHTCRQIDDLDIFCFE